MNKQHAISLSVAFASIALSACSAAETADAEGQTDQLSESLHKKCEGFRLTSPSFKDGADLPDKFSCEGKAFAEGSSPELDWTDGPRGTKSYAVVFKDLSIVDGPFPDRAFHWAVWDIPASKQSLPKSIESVQFPKALKGGQQLNGWPSAPYAYFGPCPSWENLCSGGDVPRSLDSYSFTLYALDTKKIAPPAADPSIANYVRQLDAYLQSISIGETELHVTSDARPSSAPFCRDAL